MKMDIAKIGVTSLLTAATFVVAQTWKDSLTYSSNSIFDIFLCDDDDNTKEGSEICESYKGRKLAIVAIISSAILMVFISHLKGMIADLEG